MDNYFSSISQTLFARSAVMVLLLLAPSLSSQSQNVNIKGNVSAAATPIARASVTLVDNTDTTIQVTAMTDVSGNYSLNVMTSVESSPSVPSEFALEQNYPNPFTSSTSIAYNLNKQTDVQLTIYDVLGREVKKFSVGNQSAGVHGVQWDARNDLGVKLASGVYFYTLQVGTKTISKKMVLGNSIRNVIALPAFSVHSALPQKLQNESLENKTYQLRINNYPRTSPLIVPKVIDNITLTKDTVINISVVKQTIYASATVYLDSVQQIVRGFGAANILPWRPDMTDAEIETAFGSGDGQLGFSILRLMIQPDSNQWSMNVASAKKAEQMGAIVFASPWNAPSSMAETVNGQTRVRHDMHADYAKFLSSFNAYMTNNGAPLYAVSVQNEPDYAKDWTGWTPAEMLTFMKGNTSAIGNRVIAPESFQFLHNMSDPILNDSAACANLSIVGGHLYGGGLASYPLAVQKAKEIWMTEYSSGTDSTQPNDLSWSLPVAQQISDVLQAGMSAYVWWYIVRYYGPISDGTLTTGKKGDVTKKGYVMSQFSRFIRPGYHIVQSTSSRGTVRICAAKGDGGKTVIVATNSDTEPIVQTVTLQNSSANTFFSYSTTSTKNCELSGYVTVQNGSFTVTLEPSSVVTFVSN